jgi:hypothetical protein
MGFMTRGHLMYQFRRVLDGGGGFDISGWDHLDPGGFDMSGLNHFDASGLDFDYSALEQLDLGDMVLGGMYGIDLGGFGS